MNDLIMKSDGKSFPDLVRYLKDELVKDPKKYAIHIGFGTARDILWADDEMDRLKERLQLAEAELDATIVTGRERESRLALAEKVIEAVRNKVRGDDPDESHDWVRKQSEPIGETVYCVCELCIPLRAYDAALPCQRT